MGFGGLKIGCAAGWRRRPHVALAASDGAHREPLRQRMQLSGTGGALAPGQMARVCASAGASEPISGG